MKYVVMVVIYMHLLQLFLLNFHNDTRVICGGETKFSRHLSYSPATILISGYIWEVVGIASDELNIKLLRIRN